MVNVDIFKKFVDFVSNKVDGGNAYPLVEFGNIANRAVLQKYELDYQTFIKTSEISDFLKVYLTPTVLNVPVTGVITQPSDCQHIASLRRYYVYPGGKSKMVNIKGVKNTNWGLMQVSQLLEPTLQFPKYTEIGNEIKFLPTNVGICELDYFKTPTIAVWAYTNSGGAPLYNPVGSVDFDFLPISMNSIAAIFLSLIGCNLKDTELAGFSQIFEQQNNSIL